MTDPKIADRYRKALEDIARMMTREELEMDRGPDIDGLDYEGAYDMMIELARGALALQSKNN